MIVSARVGRRVRIRALAAAFASLAHALTVNAGVLPCGTRDGVPREPTADDALFVLEAAIGLPGRCGRCLCDVDSGGSITIRDAVLVLQRAVGMDTALECPPCPCTARVRQADSFAEEIALADFNGDGLGEFVSHDGGRDLSVWLARGRGVIDVAAEYYLGSWRSRVVTADVDGDDFTDVVTNGEGYRDLVVLFGNGDGTLRDPAPFVTLSAEHLLFADLNDDGETDLVMSDYDPPSIVTRLGNGDGTFGLETSSLLLVALRSIRIGDLDADGIPDLVGIGDYEPALIVAYGEGDGAFGPPRALPVGSDPRDVEIGDMDSDGRSDLVVADARERAVRVYYGKQSRGFESPIAVPVGGAPVALVLGDLDRDGTLDVVVAQSRTDIAIVLGGVAGLQPATLLGVPDEAHEIVLTDVDADADLDIIALSDGVLVLLGRGDGTFVTERRSRATERTWHVMLGDVDADGAVDLVTADDASLSAYPGNDSGDFGWRVLTPLDARPRSSFLADVDTDGFADVVIETWAGRTDSGTVPYDTLSHVSVLRGDGNGHFSAPDPIEGLETSSIANGDIDEDGLDDFAALVYEPARVEVYIGDGQGGFQSTSGFEIGARLGELFLLDSDGDGHLDLISLAQQKVETFLWLGNGDATFQSPKRLVVEEGTTDVAAGDFDSDGRSDLVFLNAWTHSIALRFGNGRGVFVERPGFPPVPAAASGSPVVADFDADGALDIAYMSEPDDWYYPNVAILAGDGRGAFREPVVFAGRSGRSNDGVVDFVAADIDRNGVLDLLAGHGSDRDNDVTFLPDAGNCLLR